MTAKSFIGLLLAVVVVGGGLGATFAGGVAVGKNQAEVSAEPADLQLVAPTTAQADTLARDDATAAQLLEIRERIQSGEQPTAEELELLREQFEGAGAGGFGGGNLGGFGGGGFTGGGLTGTIEGLEGNAVTINTSEGPLRAVISDATVIQRLASIVPEDLETGFR